MSTASKESKEEGNEENCFNEVMLWHVQSKKSTEWVKIKVEISIDGKLRVYSADEESKIMCNVDIKNTTIRYLN